MSSGSKTNLAVVNDLFGAGAGCVRGQIEPIGLGAHGGLVAAHPSAADAAAAVGGEKPQTQNRRDSDTNHDAGEV